MIFDFRADGSGRDGSTALHGSVLAAAGHNGAGETSAELLHTTADSQQAQGRRETARDGHGHIVADARCGTRGAKTMEMLICMKI